MVNKFKINNVEVEIMKGNILSLDVDAIVNPANRMLAHGGGLAGKIVAEGGHIIQEESDRLAPINTGESVITTAGKLPCKYVIHTVGPMLGEGNEDEKIYMAFINTLKIATENNLKTIAIPAISTGVFRYPADKAAFFMRKAFYDFLLNTETSLEKILVVLYEKIKYDIFLKEFNK